MRAVSLNCVLDCGEANIQCIERLGFAQQCDSSLQICYKEHCGIQGIQYIPVDSDKMNGSGSNITAFEVKKYWTVKDTHPNENTSNA